MPTTALLLGFLQKIHFNWCLQMGQESSQMLFSGKVNPLAFTLWPYYFFYKVVSFGLSFFSCAYDQQGTLLNTLANTDGILGLSRAPISLPSQLASHGFINNVIGHCLGTDTNGGYLFLGNDFVPHWRMSWVPMLNAPFL